MARSRFATRRPDPQAGFTLLEVVAALAILLVALGVLLQSLGTGMRAAPLAARERAARAFAANLIDELGTLRPVEAGITEGVLDTGEHWRMTVAPSASTVPPGSRAPRLFEVLITVRWSSGVDAEAAFRTVVVEKRA